MPREISLTITNAYHRRFPHLAFGIGTVQSCTYFEKSESFKLYKRELLRKMRRKANLVQLEERINHYDQFFKEWGYLCPLPGHFKRTIEMGFPIINLYIDTHIIAEMCHGILMAIQDLDRFQGEWRLDLGQEGETFKEFRERGFAAKRMKLYFVIMKGWSVPFFKVRISRRE
jgi:DNA/RNA-binding domain of Phe-tRNA-synthetase-like protein